MDIIKIMAVYIQYAIPQHALSRLCAILANSKIPWLKNAMINKFIRIYGVDLSLAERQAPQDYHSFNDFFTRRLKPLARPIHPVPSSLVSPADGVISQFGSIEEGTLLQAKGHRFKLSSLLTPECLYAEEFHRGDFVTIYLSPRDYHRVHMPISGRLRQMIYVPGKLFSVNQRTSEHVDNLFARNERVICVFDTQNGPMIVILVGAMIVAGIHTRWAGRVAPSESNPITSQFYDDGVIQLNKGDELGHFELGSTVIVLLPQGSQMVWEQSAAVGQWCAMGSALADVSSLSVSSSLSE